MVKKKHIRGLRLSADGDYLLVTLARHLGLPMTSIIELAIRELASQRGIDWHAGIGEEAESAPRRSHPASRSSRK
jgi:hypothetical protein